MAVLVRDVILVEARTQSAESAYKRLSGAAAEFDAAVERSSATAVEGNQQTALSFTELNQAVELAQKGVRLFVSAFDELERGAQIADVEAAFKNLGGSAAELAKISASLKGTVTDDFIRRQSNMATTLGISRDNFASLVPIAKAASVTLGISVTQALESVTVGTARQSKLWLDNLGIIVDSEGAYKRLAAQLGAAVKDLDEFQKKQAFTNEVLRAGRDLIAKAPKNAMADAFAQARAEAKNLADEVSRLLAQRALILTLRVDIAKGEKGRKTRLESAVENVQLLRRELARLKSAGPKASIRSKLRLRFEPLRRGTGEVLKGQAAIEAVQAAERTAFARQEQLRGRDFARQEQQRENRRRAAAEAAEIAREGRRAKSDTKNAKADAKSAAARAKRAAAAAARARETEAKAAADFRATQERQLEQSLAENQERMAAIRRAARDAENAQTVVAAKRALEQAVEQIERAGAEARERIAEGRRSGAGAFGEGDLLGLVLGANDDAEGAGFISGFLLELEAAADPIAIFTQTTAAAFRGMTDSIGNAAAMAIIHGESFGKTFRKGAAQVLQGIATQAFAQSAYLLAISAVASFLPPPLGPGTAAVALTGSAALAAVGVAAAAGSRALGGGSNPARGGGGRGTASGGGGGRSLGDIGNRRDLRRTNDGPRTIVVQVRMGRGAVHDAVLDESASRGRGQPRVVMEQG